MLDRNGLVCVELLDAASPESAAQPVINACGKGGVVGGAGRKDADCRDPAVRSVQSLAQAEVGWAARLSGDRAPSVAPCLHGAHLHPDAPAYAAKTRDLGGGVRAYFRVRDRSGSPAA